MSSVSMSYTTTTPMESRNQIGIVDFLKGKNYLITGATGFVAKVLVEKILRSVPNVRKIYLLIKAKDERTAMKRLRKEITETQLFMVLKQIHGVYYEDLVMNKLIPVVGDIREPSLGMDASLATMIAKEVDVIINSAADTTFIQRYDISLNLNTKGPFHLMGFANKCRKLCLLLHVSTAYVNGNRQGIVLEKPFKMGQTLAEEMVTSKTPTMPPPVLDINAEMKIASDFLKSLPDDNEVHQKMINLGSERARIFGWTNVYVFTKAMGEMIIDNMRGDIPVVIIRPSTIESTVKEPFPGWIQGYRVLEPVLMAIGRDELREFIGDPKVVLDIIPVDLVVNAIIAAMAKHGRASKPELKVYQMTSGVVNPFEFQDIFETTRKHFASYPLVDSQGKKIIGLRRMKFMSSVDSYSSYMRLTYPNDNMVKRNIRMAKVYEPFMFYKGLFDNGNIIKLMDEMSAEEMKNFDFDVRRIDWEYYFSHIHIPGIRRHAYKETLVIVQMTNAKL
ncbi:Sterile domain-containing protein/NAD_binding_4 domain-containing protein [Cephalotus follicularis]|uniref:Fatty acyl-CoA reductase n=1 Tax=Cephalotus follicularis TaxID=3775 RepID=A0A1Q3BET3_CEPFO|nr:Sterile domain-containing protein/NAD_binding_4 domain-containing protein [Cephalotus follicularis]